MDDTVNLVAATDHEAALKALVSDILKQARDNGADAAEVSASEDAGLSVTVRLSELENVEFNRDRGFGITVYVGKRKGSASTSDSTPEAVAETVRAACNIARFTEEDPCHGLADASLMAQVFPDLDLDHPWNTSVAAAETMARQAETAARDHDRRVTNTDVLRFRRSDPVMYTVTVPASSAVVSVRATASAAVLSPKTAKACSATSITALRVR